MFNFIGQIVQIFLKNSYNSAQKLKDKITELRKELHSFVNQISIDDEKYCITEKDIKNMGDFSSEIYSLPSNIRAFPVFRLFYSLSSLESLEKVSDKLKNISYKLRDIITFDAIMKDKIQYDGKILKY